MSFEGYYQLLCEKGHLTEVDYLEAENARDGEYDVCGCMLCRAKIVYRRRIDETNADAHFIPLRKGLTRDERHKILSGLANTRYGAAYEELLQVGYADLPCDSCDKYHECLTYGDAIYEIPSEDGGDK